MTTGYQEYQKGRIVLHPGYYIRQFSTGNLKKVNFTCQFRNGLHQDFGCLILINFEVIISFLIFFQFVKVALHLILVIG